MDKSRVISVLSLLADATVAVYGRNCEVAVHDLEQLESSLVYIAGSVTGRKPGAPITDLAYTAIKEHGDDVDDVLTYRTVTKGGRILKCATTFVRDDEGHVVACCCVNQDITDFLNARAALDEFALGDNDETVTRTETFASTVEETVESIVLDCSSRLGKHPSSMNRSERVVLVGELLARDVFMMRGAVEAVATVVGVTRYTIYNYLKEAKRRAKDPGKKE